MIGALTEMLVDKIIIERHPSKIDKDGRRHYLVRAIPYQDPSRRLSASRRCTRLGSRSSPGSEQRGRANRSFDLSFSARLTHNIPTDRRSLSAEPRHRTHLPEEVVGAVRC